MTLTLYHRTSIVEAREIVESGFRDLEWEFGLQDARTGEERVATGIWLADRPLGENEGLAGDALLEVSLDATDEELSPFELEGMLWDARFWVVPADFLNARGHTRISEVDPRSSWFHEAWNEDGGATP